MDSHTNHSPPFFVVGCGRSGTTLVRTMLNKHPLLAVPLETYCIIDYLEAADSIGVDRIWRLFPSEHEINEWNVSVPETANTFDGSIAERIDRFHMEALFPAAGADTGWGQKTPRFVRFMDSLNVHWPDARFIHVVRDPRAVVSSLIRSEVHRSNAFFAARRWMRDAGAGIDFAERYPDKVLCIHYEALVTEPQQTLKQISNFLGVDYDPAMLQYQDAAQKSYDSDYYKNVHQNLTAEPKADRVDGWRQELSAADTELVEALCGVRMISLDYHLVNKMPKLRLGRVIACIIERPFGFIRQVRHMLGTRRGYAWSWMVRKTVFGVLITAVRLRILSKP